MHRSLPLAQVPNFRLVYGASLRTLFRAELRGSLNFTEIGKSNLGLKRVDGEVVNGSVGKSVG